MKKILLAILFLAFSLPAFAWQEIVQNDPYLYKFASTGTVTTVKSSQGILHVLTVTGGTTSPIDIYDGPVQASALVYSFTTTNALASYMLDINFASGCTVVTNGALKFTVSYK